MEKMMTELDLLTKHVTDAPKKMINVVVYKGYDEDET